MEFKIIVQLEFAIWVDIIYNVTYEDSYYYALQSMSYTGRLMFA